MTKKQRAPRRHAPGHASSSYKTGETNVTPLRILASKPSDPASSDRRTLDIDDFEHLNSGSRSHAHKRLKISHRVASRKRLRIEVVAPEDTDFWTFTSLTAVSQAEVSCDAQMDAMQRLCQPNNIEFCYPGQNGAESQHEQMIRAPSLKAATALSDLVGCGYLKAFHGAEKAKIELQISSDAFSDTCKNSKRSKLATVLQWLLANPPSCENETNVKEGPHPQADVDANQVYAAARPSGTEPTYGMSVPELQPMLRPYQKRALAWMLLREGTSKAGHPMHPSWCHMPTSRGMLYANLATGAVSTTCPTCPQVSGGILAEEMGLGKTVELLALVSAHRFAPNLIQDITNAEPTVSWPTDQDMVKKEEEATDNQATRPSDEKCTNQDQKLTDDEGDWPADGDVVEEEAERVACVCGAVDEAGYEGLWVQCGTCQAWLHATCCGFTRPPRGSFECGSCQRQRASTQVVGGCGATLVVCPASILQQWQSEIERHLVPGAMKVITYEGQRQPVAGGGDSHPKIVTPAELAAADVVLTTYEVLRQDLHRQPDAEVSQRSMRNHKKYQVIPTPLTRLKWWRVCLDEAQMVESSTAAAAAMAARLQAVHHWAITGTPMSRGLDDLYGLMTFLQAEPWADRQTWNRLIQHPCSAGDPAGWERLVQLLRPADGGLMWRSSKADVSNELGLPPQEQRLTTLSLSAIEHHFYRRQHQACLAQARKALPARALAATATGRAACGEDGNRRLTRREEQQLLAPLLRLRQACCHPQVGGGGLKALGTTKQPLSMEDILENLLARARLEAEDAQRVLLGALNGLAGVLLLENEPEAAVAAFRQVLSIAAENKAEVRMDPLQRLHTLVNLSKLLDSLPPGCRVARTLRDDSLMGEAEEIRQQYLAESVASLAQSDSELSDCLSAPHGLPTGADAQWWSSAIQLIRSFSDDGGFSAAEAIRQAMDESDQYRTLISRNATSMARRFRDLSGLGYLLDSELAAISAAQEHALAELQRLRDECQQPSPQLIEQAAHCGRCRGLGMGIEGSVCRHCHLDEAAMAWELRLFCLTATGRGTSHVTAEQAVAQAQADARRRVGKGGLNEGGAEAPLPEGAKRAAGAVGATGVVHKPSEAEMALRLLASRLRLLSGLPPAAARQKERLLQSAKSHQDRLEADKKLCWRARALAGEQRVLLYAHDELAMAGSRLALRQPGEAVSSEEERLGIKLYATQLPIRNAELSADKAVAETDLSRKLGTLRYLGCLKTARARAISAHPSTDAASPPLLAAKDGQSEVCPVCHEALGPELVVLPCGHPLCHSCTLAMLERSRATHHSNCPCCRQRFHEEEVSYVDSRTPASRPADAAAAAAAADKSSSGSSSFDDDNDIAVIGSYGSKLEAVLRRLKAITRADADARILVFSTWADVLEILSHALTANHLPYAYAKTAAKFQAELERFKLGAREESVGGREVPRVLLMLVKQGGNGLNLTEAQHVILVEPLLNPALEAQAIGRVHRMGQTQTTVLHKFVVQHTVEQNVHRLCSVRRAQPAADVVQGGAGDVRQLTIADVADLLTTDAWKQSPIPQQQPAQGLK